jgi:hypothetical protein
VTIIFTFLLMALIIYLVFTGRIMTQDETEKELGKALIEKFS